MVWLIQAGTAWACGGFFCNTTDPVEQTGETVIFEVNDGVVSVHARVAFQGDATDFAWVLPAPGIPEVFLSWEGLFDQLQLRTEPVTVVERSVTPGCPLTFMGADATDADADADSDSDTDSDADVDSVNVLATESVGPYEGVVLDASDPEALAGWLTDNAYGIPDTFAAAAAPYLAQDMNFLALKLQTGATVGDLRPLGVRWAGERASIPLTLTAVAATPDLPLTVYVLGPTRAVPLSYLHVELNPLVYDWFDYGWNWLEMVGLAANEAGGRAFATTYANTLPALHLGCNTSDTSDLVSLTVPIEWFTALDDHGFQGTTELLDVLRHHVPAPPGVDEIEFYNFPSDYKTEWKALSATFDPVAATAELTTRIVEPCLDAQAATVRNAYVTRLTSMMSPEEMTVDPTFGFNPDLGPVLARRDAELEVDCGSETATLTLPGGYALHVPELDSRNNPTEEWLRSQLLHHALIIRQMSESGEGAMIADYSSDFPPLPDPAALDQDPTSTSACGCASAGSGSAIVLVLVGGITFARRRRIV